MKRNAPAQIKTPASWLKDFPALGQARLDGEIGPARDEALIDIAEKAEREGFVQAVRVERPGVALEREAQALRGSGTGGHSEGERSREDRA